MKKIFLTLAFVIFSFSTLFAQIEAYGRLVDGKVEPDINIFGTKVISEKVNLTYFALVEETWSECLVGVSYSPNENISVGISTGIEHKSSLYRFGGSIWVGNDKASLLILLEKGDGRDNTWYKTVGQCRISKNITLGISAWRFHGVGPLLKVDVNKDIKLWLNPAYDTEKNKVKTMAGIDIKF